MHCNTEFYYDGKIHIGRAPVAAATRGFESYALQCGILLRRENPRTDIGHPSQQRHVVFRRRNTVVGGKCALPRAVLVYE